MPFTITASAPVRPTNLLTFDQIKNTPGLYINRRGVLLLIASTVGALVSVPSTGAKKVTSSGFTRTGMIAFRPTPNGSLRPSHLKCGKGPDGNAVWEKYTGSLTLNGNAMGTTGR
jgi:hypothetical protein